MNPWEIFLTVLGWIAVVALLLVAVLMVIIAIGAVSLSVKRSLARREQDKIHRKDGLS